MNPVDKLKKLSRKLKETNDPIEKQKIYKEMKRIQTFGINSMYGATSIPNSLLLNDIDINKKKLYGVIRNIRIEFDNSKETSTQHYKTPIKDISIEAVNPDSLILERRLNKIFTYDISFLINDIIKYLKEKLNRPVLNFQYTVENHNCSYLITFTTDLDFKGSILFSIREIEIK